MAGRRIALTVAAAAASACVVMLARATSPIEIDADSFQGRTDAAIKDFRAAVALVPDLSHGMRLFAACSQCHQADGSGSADGSIPVIAGQHVSVIVKQLVDFKHDRRWHALMQNTLKEHGFASPQDLLDVAAYAESLPRPPPRQDRAGAGAAAQAGQLVYYRSCVECHGRLGEGDLRTLRPRLAGQHYPYLLRQLNETASGLRPGMDEAHVKRIKALSAEERSAVADYLSRLTPELTSTEADR